MIKYIIILGLFICVHCFSAESYIVENYSTPKSILFDDDIIYFSAPVTSSTIIKLFGTSGTRFSAFQDIILENNLSSLSLQSITVNLTGILLSTQGYVRVTLIDSENHERLIFGSDSFALETNVRFSVKNICEETCNLNGMYIKKIKVEVYNAELVLGSLMFNKVGTIPPLSTRLASIQKEIKIDVWNSEIAENGWQWKAGNAPASDLTFEQKKQKFGYTDPTTNVQMLPNFSGHEYYAQGVFQYHYATPTSSGLAPKIFQAQMATPSVAAGPVYTAPPSWNWYNAHGMKYLSPNRNQGSVGSCGYHSIIGAIEGQIQRYYNYNFNLNLSEQFIIDCMAWLPQGNIKYLFDAPNPVPAFDGSCGSSAANFLTKLSNPQIGIVDETCDAYDTSRFRITPTPKCNAPGPICGNWNNRSWKLAYYHAFQLKQNVPSCKLSVNLLDSDNLKVIERFKKAIIDYGPMDSGIIPWHHAMTLVGYKQSSVGTQWIFKQSYGDMTFNWCGMPGYECVVVPTADLIAPTAPLTYFSDEVYTNATYVLSAPTNPSYSLTTSSFNLQIQCRDYDKDGYCYWGSTPNKPASCPSSCKPLKDCDDASSAVTTECHYPDLVITNITSDSLSIYVTYQNIGGIRQYDTSDMLKRLPGGEMLFTVNLSANEQTTISSTILSVPQSNTYNVITFSKAKVNLLGQTNPVFKAEIDLSNRVTELNERNNFMTSELITPPTQISLTLFPLINVILNPKSYMTASWSAPAGVTPAYYQYSIRDLEGPKVAVSWTNVGLDKSVTFFPVSLNLKRQWYIFSVRALTSTGAVTKEVSRNFRAYYPMPPFPRIQSSAGAFHPGYPFTLKATHLDPEDGNKLVAAWILIAKNPAISTNPIENARIELQFDNTRKIFYLLDENGNFKPSSSCAPGANTVLETPLVKFYCNGSSATILGKSLTIVYKLETKPNTNFVGSKHTYLYQRDFLGVGAGWGDMGTGNFEAR